MSVYDIFPVKEVSGNIVTFEDGADGIPMESLSAVISPVQDLHGYAKPWPAGGGKNKLNNILTTCTRDNTTFTTQNDGSVIAVSTSPPSAATYADLVSSSFSLPEGTYILSGCPAGGWTNSYDLRIKITTNGTSQTIFDYGSGVEFTVQSGTVINHVRTVIKTNYDASAGVTFYPMIRLASVADDSYEPYSNICPITGLTGLSVYVSPTQNQQDATTYAVDWTSQAGTVYSGTVDVVTGVLTVSKANIPSYNGETINEPWLSSMDAYAAGTTPTIGAQVVYTLATPLTYQLTPQEVTTLLGLNNVWADVAPVTVKYHSQTLSGGKQIDSLFVDGVDMQADGWFLKWRRLAAPKPKTDYVSVWGRDGDVDLTESETDGQVFYENRNLTMDMVYIGDDWTDAYSDLLDKLHGKNCIVQFSSDPYWYWSGRISASLYEHKPHSLSMDGTVFPYKMSVTKTTASATVNGVTESNAVDVVLPGSRMRVSPKVTVTAGTGESVTLKWGSKTQTLSAGTYYVRGLKVGDDDVTIKVYGTGTVSFEYRKGKL